MTPPSGSNLVDPMQTVFGVALVVVLLFLAFFYSWRQVRALRRLRSTDLPAAETRFVRQQAWRRLVGCMLMLVLAAMLSGALVYLEGKAQSMADARAAQRAQGESPPFTDEEKDFLHLWGGAWIAILIILMIIIFLAGLDLWSTHRFGIREHRKIMADRRAMIERQVARLRRERNGHS
jgi:hypothetical protein